LVADGYTIAEKSKFHQAAQSFQQVLFAQSPYREHQTQFTIQALFVPSPKSGIHDPNQPQEVEPVFGSSFGALGIDRYLLPRHVQTLYDTCDHTLWDTIIVLCNSDKFGGGGLYNQFAVAAAHAQDFDYLVVHEFGHSFAGLADEYYTKPVTYCSEPEPDANPAPAPWEANVDQIRLDPTTGQPQVKWQTQIPAQIPIPTPWPKPDYEALMADYEALRATAETGRGEAARSAQTAMAAMAAQAKSLLDQHPYADQVGAFEGAKYQAQGLYRPASNCIMFSRNAMTFCPVCQQAIRQVIDDRLQAKLNTSGRGDHAPTCISTNIPYPNRRGQVS
jgi:hypothetical protein